MSWTTLTPERPCRRFSSVTAAVRELKDKRFRIYLHICQRLWEEEFGSPPRADILEGDGAFTGHLRIHFHKDGAFKLARFTKGGGRTMLPLVKCVEPQAHPCEDCEIISIDKATGILVVKLPLAAWAKGPRPLTEHAQALAIHGNVKAKLDIVAWLAGEGRQVVRRGNGQGFRMDGDDVTLSALVSAANRIRARKGLVDALTEQDCY